MNFSQFDEKKLLTKQLERPLRRKSVPSLRNRGGMDQGPCSHKSHRTSILPATTILKSKFEHYFNLSKLVFTTPCGNVFYISRMDNMALCFLNVTWNKEGTPTEVKWNWPNKIHNHQSDCSMLRSGWKLPQPLCSLFWWEWHRLPCCKPRQPTQSPERAHKL